MGGRVWLGGRRVVAAGAAAAAALALAACTHGTDPVPSPSTSSSAGTSSSSSSSGVILDMPALAREHSKAGAGAFGRFVLELTDESFVRSDAAQLRSISNAGCRGCELFAGDVEKRRRDGKHNRERSLRVIKAAWVEKYKGKEVVDVLINTFEVDVLNSSGKKVDVQHGSGQGAFRLDLVWQQNRWTVSQLNALVAEK